MKNIFERCDSEEFLQDTYDIWNHPRVTNRTESNSYEVADIMADYANHCLQEHPDTIKLREAVGFIRSLMDLTNPVGLIKYKLDAFLKQIDNENK